MCRFHTGRVRSPAFFRPDTKALSPTKPCSAVPSGAADTMTDHVTRRPAPRAQPVARETNGSLSRFERVVLCALVHTACFVLWTLEHLPAPTGHRRLAQDRRHPSIPRAG